MTGITENEIVALCESMVGKDLFNCHTKDYVPQHGNPTTQDTRFKKFLTDKADKLPVPELTKLINNNNDYRTRTSELIGFVNDNDMDEIKRISLARVLTLLAFTGTYVTERLPTPTLLETAVQIHQKAAVCTILLLREQELITPEMATAFYQQCRPYMYNNNENDNFKTICDRHFLLPPQWEWMYTLLPHIDLTDQTVWSLIVLSICVLGVVGCFNVFPGPTFGTSFLQQLYQRAWQTVVMPLAVTLTALSCYEVLAVLDHIVTSLVNYLSETISPLPTMKSKIGKDENDLKTAWDTLEKTVSDPGSSM